MIRIFVSAVCAVSAIALLSGCGKGDQSSVAKESSQAEPVKEIKLGVVGEHNEEWEYVRDKLAKEGITLTLVKFADYTLPNRSLHDGEIDLNSFQHVAFLNAENEQKGFQTFR